MLLYLENGARKKKKVVAEDKRVDGASGKICCVSLTKQNPEKPANTQKGTNSEVRQQDDGVEAIVVMVNGDSERGELR